MTDKPKKKRTGNPMLKKGVVLNPKGRPKGSKNKMSLLAAQMMTDRGPMIVEKVMGMALDGDVHCLKMCMDRILPVQKAIDPNKARQDSQIVINVGSSADIQAKIEETPQEKLVNPKVKSEEEVIIDVVETK